MEKTEQTTTIFNFKEDEFNKLIMHLDLVVASLHVATDHESDVFDATPIFYEALSQAIEARNIVANMDFSREVNP